MKVSGRLAHLVAEATKYRMTWEADLFQSGASEMTGKLRVRESGDGEGGGKIVLGRFKGVKDKSLYRHYNQAPAVLARAIRAGNRRGRRGRLYRELYRDTRKHVLEHDLPELESIIKKRPDATAKEHRAMVAAHPSFTRKCKSCERWHTEREHRGHGKGSFSHRGRVLGAPGASNVEPEPDWFSDLL